MSQISLSGNDTLNIGGRVLADFAEGDIAELTFPNELMNVKTGKNGNSIFAFNFTGLQCDFKARILRGSSDDKYLNGLMQGMKSDPASFVVLDAQFVKRIGDGQGNITNDTYILGGGVPVRQIAATSNTDGITDQSVSVYEFKFTNTNRGIL